MSQEGAVSAGPLRMRYTVATRTHAGKVRGNNEDFVEAARLPGGECQLVALADGMARHAGGEVASKLAVETLVAHVRRRAEEGLPEDAEELVQLLATGFEEAHGRIDQKAIDETKLTGMGTTLVAALLTPERVVYQYAGDSRLYWLREGKVERVTRDHSAVQVLVELGKISAEEADRHPMAGKLLSFLGASSPWDQVELSPAAVEEATFAAAPGDVLLLCSDGVSGEISGARLAELLCQTGDAEERAQRVLEAVLEGPARDNATVAVIVCSADDAREGRPVEGLREEGESRGEPAAEDPTQETVLPEDSEAEGPAGEAEQLEEKQAECPADEAELVEEKKAEVPAGEADLLEERGANSPAEEAGAEPQEDALCG